MTGQEILGLSDENDSYPFNSFHVLEQFINTNEIIMSTAENKYLG